MEPFLPKKGHEVIQSNPQSYQQGKQNFVIFFGKQMQMSTSPQIQQQQ